MTITLTYRAFCIQYLHQFCCLWKWNTRSTKQTKISVISLHAINRWIPVSSSHTSHQPIRRYTSCLAVIEIYTVKSFSACVIVAVFIRCNAILVSVSAGSRLTPFSTTAVVPLSIALRRHGVQWRVQSPQPTMDSSPLQSVGCFLLSEARLATTSWPDWQLSWTEHDSETQAGGRQALPAAQRLFALSSHWAVAPYTAARVSV